MIIQTHSSVTEEKDVKNFRLHLDSDKNTIKIEYFDLVQCRTLFKSLEELIDLGMMERVSLTLDFNNISKLLVSYRQMINFRIGLNALPSKKIHRITIINNSRNLLISTICSCTKIVEDYVAMKADSRCFEVNSAYEVYQS